MGRHQEVMVVRLSARTVKFPQVAVTKVVTQRQMVVISQRRVAVTVALVRRLPMALAQVLDQM